jgi:predicted nucleic acid-binding protein
MAATVFVDTNLLVYPRDVGDAEEHAQALEWLQILWDTKRVPANPRVLVNEASVRASRPRQAAGEGRDRCGAVRGVSRGQSRHPEGEEKKAI